MRYYCTAKSEDDSTIIVVVRANNVDEVIGRVTNMYVGIGKILRIEPEHEFKERTSKYPHRVTTQARKASGPRRGGHNTVIVRGI